MRRYQHHLLVLLSLVLAGVLSVLAGPVAANPLRGMQRLFKDWGLFQGLQVNGQYSLTGQQSFIEGSRKDYEGQRWDTAPIIRTSSLSLEGPIWKEFAFKADLSSTGYGPSYGRWVVGYVGHDTAVYYGDLNIDLSGNEFVTFSKAVHGWQIDQRVGRGLARAFVSKEQGYTRTQTFAGNNTTGPFFLTFTPIIEGSEVVKVNEQVQRFGEDYRLDYDTGQLWFEIQGQPSKIIPDTATITVSYQSSGFNNSPGKLYGARAELPLMGDRLRLGATMITQDRGGKATARDTVGYHEDIFQGSGSTGPFDVNYRPIIPNGSQVVYQGEVKVIQQPLLVLVDNIEQAEGVDYDAYRQIGRIIFRRSVPATALVIIRYFHDISTDVVAGKRQLTGLDFIYHLNPKLNLRAEYGQSDGGEEANSGNAYRANLSYNTRNLRAVMEYRNTSPTFTYLDAVGFYRHDKGLDTMVNWQAGEHVDVALRHSDLKSREGWSFGYSPYASGMGTLDTAQTDDETGGLDIRSLRDDLELRLDYPGWPAFSVMRQKMSNTGSTRGNSTYLSTAYQLSYAPAAKPFSLTASLYDSDQSYLAIDDTTTDGTALSGSKTQQLQWSANYRPGTRLSLSISQGRNTSDARGSDNRSSSNTSQYMIRWAPSDKLDITWDQSQTASLGSVSSGFYSGGGVYGYAAQTLYPALNPGGGDGGDEDDDKETNRYEDSGSRLSVSYRPKSDLSLDLSMMKRKYTSGGSVGYLADSDQLTRSLSAVWQINPTLSLNATLGKDSMTFLEEGRGKVANNMLTIGATYRLPDSPWGFSLSYNKQSGTSPTYTGFGPNQKMRIVNNNLSDLRGQVTYSLNQYSDIVLSAEASKFAGGYANFNKQQVDIGYRRRLGNLADLTFGYRYIRNLSDGNDDPRYGDGSLTPRNPNYVANNLMLTLSAQFSSSLGSAGDPSSPPTAYGPGSLSNFGGYRAGPGLASGTGSSAIGTGYGTFEQMRVFNRGTRSDGFSSPFGSFGGSSYGGYGSYGQYGMGSSYSSGRPMGYSNFGGGFGSSGGFSTGLGNFAGRDRQDDFGDSSSIFGPLQPGEMPLPGMDDERPGTPQIPSGDGVIGQDDWQSLDDLRSIWW